MRADIEVAVLAFDATNHSRNGDRAALQLDLSPENHARAQADGIVVPFRLDLPAGRYQLHIGAKNVSSERVGTLRYDIEVPDFSKAPLTFSSVVVAGGGALDPPFVRPDETTERLLGQPATLVREFARGETLVAAAEVYIRPAGPDMTIVGELRAIEGRVVWTSKPCPVSPAGASPTKECRVIIPLGDLPKGEYSFRFAAKPPAGPDIGSRDVAFAVR